MAYSSAEDVFADADAKIELAQTLLARVQPIGGSPAELYLTKTRKIPPEAVVTCPDLGYLPSPIEGRPVVDHGLVSQLRDAAGETSGFQVEFIDILGNRTAAEPTKQTFSLRPNGCRDGLFLAGGAGSDTAFLVEGYSCKPLSLVPLGIGRAYGGGGLRVLGFAVPPERRVVLVPDRAPAPDQWTKDGKEKLVDQHVAAYARAVDRLLLSGREVEVAVEPDCKCCRDSDAFLKKHGAIRLKDLLARTTPGEQSRHGWVRKLAAIDNRLDRAAALKEAAETAGVLKGIPIALLRELVEEERAKTRAAPPPEQEVNQDELAAEAADIIASPDVLERFAAAIGRVVAGETRNAKILYLIGTSRLFLRVMSGAVKGPSAAGKSELRKNVLEYFPPEDVISFTTLSEKSLLYFEEDFSHKILSMGEASGTEEQSLQDYLLRELISEGRLRYPVVQKIDGELSTTIIEKNGPVSFLVTTTKNALDPEIETRLVALEIDDTSEQTRLVLRKVAEVEGNSVAETYVEDLERWRAYQRWLAGGARSVVVPYAEALAALMSAKAVRLRRDLGQLLRAIKAHALLHREHRARAFGHIVADIENDYAAVRELLADVIAHGAELAVSPSIKETIDAVAALTGAAAVQAGVTALEVGKKLNLDKSSARRRLVAAASAGHLTNLETKRGRPGRYIVAAAALDAQVLLPTPAELAAYTPSATPSESMPPCHHSQKAEQEQEVNGGKRGGNPDATAATAATTRSEDGGTVASDREAVPPPVPPLSPSADTGNSARWHGGTVSAGVPEGGIPGNGADAAADGPCAFCGKDPIEGLVVEVEGGRPACFECAAAQAPPSPPKKRSRIKRPPADAEPV